MKVELIRYTENAEELIAVAARMCYTPDKGSDMIAKITPETVDRMIKMALENHHDSLLEHVTFTFLVEDVSRALTHQLVRHRLCTFHQRSQRYVKTEDLIDECVIPESIRDDLNAKNIFLYAISTIENCYNSLINDHNIPREEARYLLPNAIFSQLIMTVNARQLIHMCGLRCCNRAQAEIHELFDRILQLCRGALPAIFNRVGPNCYINKGFCPEGKLSCGKRKAVMDRYNPERNEKLI